MIGHIKMKRLIVFLIFTLIGCTSCYSNEPDQQLSASTKYEMGKEIKKIVTNFLNTDLLYLCRPDLSVADTRTTRLLLRNFQKCFNSTVDSFINQINDNDLNDLNHYSSIGRVIKPFCALHDNIFLCMDKFSPVIDLCLPLEYLHIKSKVLSFVPTIHNTMCMDNGTDLVLLLQYHADFHCVGRAFEKQFFAKLLETVLASDEAELFTTKSTCVDMLYTGENITTSLIQCPQDVTDIVLEMMGKLCDNTKCNRVIGYTKCEFTY